MVVQERGGGIVLQSEMNLPAVADPLIEPVVRMLRVVGGKRVRDSVPSLAALTSPPRVARTRRGEHLFLLLDLDGPTSPHLYRELREVVAQTYWAAAGSTTAALRRAAAAANQRLFRANLGSSPSDRCTGGLICAALREEEVFVLQAGQARTCVLHERCLRWFSLEEELPPLGVGRFANVLLSHTFVAPGDTVLLASSALVRAAGDAGIARVLPRASMREVLEGLEQVGSGYNFAAMVMRWNLPETTVAPWAEKPMARETREPPRSLVPSEASAVSDLDEFTQAAETRELPQSRPKSIPRRRFNLGSSFVTWRFLCPTWGSG